MMVFSLYVESQTNYKQKQVKKSTGHVKCFMMNRVVFLVIFCFNWKKIIASKVSILTKEKCSSGQTLAANTDDGKCICSNKICRKNCRLKKSNNASSSKYYNNIIGRHRFL